MTIEGELTVRLAWDGRRVRRVAITSSRPFVITRVLAGRTPQEASALVPRLFSVCGAAQGAAAAAAFDAASTHCDDPGRVTARELTAVVEAAQEHFWRLLIDWPKAMDHAPLTAPVAAARRETAPVLARLAASLTPGGEQVLEPQRSRTSRARCKRWRATYSGCRPPHGSGCPIRPSSRRGRDAGRRCLRSCCASFMRRRLTSGRATSR